MLREDKWVGKKEESVKRRTLSGEGSLRDLIFAGRVGNPFLGDENR